MDFNTSDYKAPYIRNEWKTDNTVVKWAMSLLSARK